MNRRAAFAATAMALAVTPLPAAAQTLVIDGEWCSIDGIRTMTIDGPTIITHDGSRLTGDYAGHFFRYEVPDGRPGDRTVAMILVDHDTLRLTNARNQWSALYAAGEIWHRCERQAAEVR